MNRSRIGWLAVLFVCLGIEAFARPLKPTLIGGVEVDPAAWKPVVNITVGNSGCTATVVGPRVILSAGHCATTGSIATFTAAGKNYRAKMTRSALYPTPGLDISLGITTEDIAGVTPISIGGTPTTGKEIVLLGYGCTTVDGTGFDGKLRMGRALVTDVEELRFNSSNGGGALLCPGDSGGPAFYQTGDTFTVVGVNSAVGVTESGSITGPNYNARLDGKRPAASIADFIAKNNAKICGVNLNCGQVVPPAEPSCELTASSESVMVGSPITLSLSSKNAVSAQIDGVSVGVPNGQRIVTPQSTGTQTSTGVVVGAGSKSSSCSKSYVVTPKTPDPAISCELVATPKAINLGETVTVELNAKGGAVSATIDGTSVSVPSGKLILTPRSKGDFSAEGIVRSASGASSSCYADYRVNDGGVVPPPAIPTYGVVSNFCGADQNPTASGISQVCLGTVKKDATLTHIGFSEVVKIVYADRSVEVLPILARRPVGASANKEELGLFANAVVSGNGGATLDMRLATLTKGSGGLPSSMEGKTKLNKNFRAALSPQ